MTITLALIHNAMRSLHFGLTLFALFFAVSTSAQSSWDQSTAPQRTASPQPRDRTPPPPPSIRETTPARIPTPAHTPASVPTPTPRPSRRSTHIPPHLYSVILDSPTVPMYRYQLGTISSAQFGEDGQSGQIELDANHNLAYFVNVMRGDLDVGLTLHTTVFTSKFDARFSRYVTRLALDTGWTWRFLNGQSFEIRAYPGFYGAFDAAISDLAAVPLRLLLHRAIHPDLAGVVGVEIRLGWDRAFLPMGGIVWEPYPHLRAELMLPRSRASLMLGPATLFANAEWRNWSYAISEDEHGARQISFDEYALSLGAGWRFTDELELTVEFGRLIDRTLDTDSAEDRPTDIGDATLIRLALIGPF